MGRDLWMFWSGEDIFDLSRVSTRQNFRILAKFEKIIHALNFTSVEVDIWLTGIIGKVQNNYLKLSNDEEFVKQFY